MVCVGKKFDKDSNIHCGYIIWLSHGNCSFTGHTWIEQNNQQNIIFVIEYNIWFESKCMALSRCVLKPVQTRSKQETYVGGHHFICLSRRWSKEIVFSSILVSDFNLCTPFFASLFIGLGRTREWFLPFRFSFFHFVSCFHFVINWRAVTFNGINAHDILLFWQKSKYNWSVIN